jgi:DNA-binding transcriptional MerR regulator
VDVTLTIGEFSKMTYLSVKALRHYHDVGLLEPAAVDPSSGYRRYTPDQVPTAQAIRRFRDLDMPIERVRAVLEAPTTDARNEAILEHLRDMRSRLERTQATVASLQALLEHPTLTIPPAVEYRRLPAITAVGADEVVAFDDSGDWLDAALARLHAELDAAGAAPTGPDGALYHDEFFEAGAGRVVAFVPVAGGPLTLPPVEVAVLVHHGPFGDLDRTYGALGTVVASRGIGAGGPVREHYLADDLAEVCWPVRTGATP